MISTNEQIAAVAAFAGGFVAIVILTYVLAFIKWVWRGIMRWWKRETAWIGDLKRLIELASSPSAGEEHIRNRKRRRKACYEGLLP